MIMTLSLLVYSAIEYKIRQELQGQRVDFVDQRKKPTRKPTARNAFWGFLLFPWFSCGVHPGILQSRQPHSAGEDHHRHPRAFRRAFRRAFVCEILQ